MKMKNVLLFFVLMSVFSSYCKAVDQFTKKFCDKSLSNATISELEQCEKILAKQVRNVQNSIKFLRKTLVTKHIYFLTNVQLIILYDIRRIAKIKLNAI
jgi:hypothetical protein